MNANKLNKMGTGLGMAILLLVSSGWSDAKSELDELTGGIHTRVVWRPGGHMWTSNGNEINGFDSKTGEIHTVYSGSVIRPIMCSNGRVQANRNHQTGYQKAV